MLSSASLLQKVGLLLRSTLKLSQGKTCVILTKTSWDFNRGCLRMSPAEHPPVATFDVVAGPREAKIVRKPLSYDLKNSYPGIFLANHRGILAVHGNFSRGTQVLLKQQLALTLTKQPSPCYLAECGILACRRAEAR